MGDDPKRAGSGTYLRVSSTRSEVTTGYPKPSCNSHVALLRYACMVSGVTYRVDDHAVVVVNKEKEK